MRTLLTTPCLILSIATVAFGHPRPTQPEVPDLTHLEACNQGSETVYAFNSTKGPDGYLSQTLAWLAIEPGECNNLYSVAVPNVESAYIGFALKNRDGRLVSVPATVPAYGRNAKGAQLFISSSTAFCALPYPDEADFSLFKSKEANDAEHCDEWVSKKVSDPARRHYAAFASSVYFSPSLDCSGFGGCQGNSYQIDLTVDQGRNRIVLARAPSPVEVGMKFLAQMLDAYQKAKAYEDYEKLVELQSRFARFKPGSAMSWQEQWEKAPQLSAAQYDSSLSGSTVVVRGVIDHYSVDTRHFPNWISIFFRDAPNGPFVVCSPYPDMFQEVVGLNLDALVGKTLEIVGPVESPMCSRDTGQQLTGSIRVLESGMFHIR
jgi:hypothetical protein